MVNYPKYCKFTLRDSLITRMIRKITSAHLFYYSAYLAGSGFLSASLISHYTFDDITKGISENTFIINDASWNQGNHQLFVSGEPDFRKGVHGNALYFSDPANFTTYASYSSNDDFMSGVSGISVSCWVNVENFPDAHVDVAVIAMLSVGGSGGNSRFVLAINKDGQVEMGARSLDNERYQSVFTERRLLKNEWVHLAGVVDYPADTIEIYVDGVKQELVSDRVSFLSNTTSNTTGDYFGIGASNFYSGEFFQGGVDELRFFDEALGENTIEFLADSSRINVNPVRLSVSGILNDKILLSFDSVVGRKYGISWSTGLDIDKWGTGQICARFDDHSCTFLGNDSVKKFYYTAESSSTEVELLMDLLDEFPKKAFFRVEHILSE